MAGGVRVETNLPGTSTACAFCLKPMHKKKISDIENEGQGHGVQHSQWFHSMANINLYKRRSLAFFR